MQIKRFEAKTFNQALQQIKQEFGPDAVILSATRRNAGWLGVFRKPGVIVTAAMDAPGNPDRKQIAASGANKTEEPASSYHHGEATKPPVSTVSNSDSPPVANGAERLRGGKRFIPSPAAELLEKRFIAGGIAAATAAALIKHITPGLKVSADIAPQTLRALLARALKADGLRVAPIRQEPHRRRIIVFVGPTGVGKTSTIAKLAANFTRQQAPVSLITLDHERIGAVDQMRRYAGIIGIPFYSAADSEQLRQAVAITGKQDLVFIDTPGLSPRNRQKIEQLAGLMSVLKYRTTHLLLPASACEPAFNTIREGFQTLAPDCLLFTKIDETNAPAAIITQLINSNMPVSYLTTGQQIPEDIREADADALAELIAPLPEKMLLIPPQANPTEIQPATTDNPAADLALAAPVRAIVVANRHSDIYHRPHCRCVAKISDDHKIEFDSQHLADQHHFQPCKHCCGKEAKEIEKQDNLWNE